MSSADGATTFFLSHSPEGDDGAYSPWSRIDDELNAAAVKFQIDTGGHHQEVVLIIYKGCTCKYFQF